MVSHSLVQSIFTFFRKRVAEIHLSTREIQPNNELPTAVECFLNLIGQPTSNDKVNFLPAVTNSNWPNNNGSVSELLCSKKACGGRSYSNYLRFQCSC